MLQLRVFADPSAADDVVRVLVASDGIRHVQRSDPAEPSLDAVVTVARRPVR